MEPEGGHMQLESLRDRYCKKTGYIPLSQRQEPLKTRDLAGESPIWHVRISLKGLYPKDHRNPSRADHAFAARNLLLTGGP